jgi:steroid 5-alpha reductase family enzyme
VKGFYWIQENLLYPGEITNRLMSKLMLLENAIPQIGFPEVFHGINTGTFLGVMTAAALVCFVVSEITRNYSQVDKLWSLMPIVYSVITILAFPSPRAWIMGILATIWGLRLSYNFSRKGGYNIIPWRGAEDYRWEVMRNRPELKGRLRFGLFNLFFISFYQHFLILLFSSPLLIAAKYQDQEITLLDKLAAALMLLFIVIETIADNQQFRFQSLKRQKEGSGLYRMSLKNGFLSEGLWQYVRHPNFASEQLIWVSFYLFGVAASGKWMNWTIAGPVLLILLFIGSSELTEKLSGKKYPGYAEYRKNVPRFFPNPFKLFFN